MKYRILEEYADMLEKEGLLISYDGGYARDAGMDVQIKDISYNSILCGEGTLFICKGANFKSQYLSDAIEKGDVGFVCSSDFDEIDRFKNIPHLVVGDMRRAISKISAMYFDRSWDRGLKLVGLTGTKGKSTTATMIKSILDVHCGREVGFSSGIYTYDGKQREKARKLTTPETIELHRILDGCVRNDCKYLVMEVSSQALKVGRVDGMIFDYGVFTNLTQDHIGDNEHANMEEYIYCKSLLFKQCKHGIFNIDDSHYSDMICECGCDIHTYGCNEKADLIIKDIKLLRKENFIGINVTTSGMVNDTFLVNTPGEFSAYNSVSAIMVTNLIGCDIRSIKKALSKVAVKGRVEIIPVSNKFSVIIDYAHNGVSMENILTTMRCYNPKRIVTLFGAGGNRSRDRRYDMGEISGNMADFTIITEDNSRYEDVNDIMNDIEVGLKKTNGKYIKIADRTKAIKYALDNAIEGDIILLLGKGHETYYEKNGERIHYDEREVIQKIINNVITTN